MMFSKKAILAILFLINVNSANRETIALSSVSNASDVIVN